MRKAIILFFLVGLLLASFTKKAPTEASGEVEQSGQNTAGEVKKNQDLPDSREESLPTDQPSVNYEVVEREMYLGWFVISVWTEHLDEAKRIAQELVDQNSDQDQIQILFYPLSGIPMKDSPLMLFEWTKNTGLNLKYDTRLPPPHKEQETTLPEYEVLFQVVQIYNNRVYGDVLVPTLSRTTPVEKRKEVARAICYQENLDDITLYSTRDAYAANNSASFLKSHPDALKEGYLGSFREGKFTPGEKLYP